MVSDSLSFHKNIVIYNMLCVYYIRRRKQAETFRQICDRAADVEFNVTTKPHFMCSKVEILQVFQAPSRHT